METIKFTYYDNSPETVERQRRAIERAFDAAVAHAAHNFTTMDDALAHIDAECRKVGARRICEDEFPIDWRRDVVCKLAELRGFQPGSFSSGWFGAASVDGVELAMPAGCDAQAWAAGREANPRWHEHCKAKTAADAAFAAKFGTRKKNDKLTDWWRKKYWKFLDGRGNQNASV